MKFILPSLPLTFSFLALSFLNNGSAFAKTITPVNHTSNSSEYIIANNPQYYEREIEIKIEPPLTGEQKTKVNQIEAEYEPKLRAAAEKYRDSLRGLDSIIGTNPTNTVIKEKRAQMLDDERALKDLAFERLMEVRSVLTDKQKQSIADSMRKLLGKE